MNALTVSKVATICGCHISTVNNYERKGPIIFLHPSAPYTHPKQKKDSSQNA